MKKWISVSMVGLVILIDQVTKYFAMVHLSDEYPKVLLPILDLRLTFNHGVAFSMFYAKGLQTPWVLIALTSILSIIVFYLLMQAKEKMHQLAYTFILGGALANIMDRIRFGAVVDFIDAHIQHYHWPVFNLADSFICLGAFLLLLSMSKKDSE
jgi:signal peptidase II